MPRFLSELVPALSDAGATRQVVVAQASPRRAHRDLEDPGVRILRAYRPGWRFHRVGRVLAGLPCDIVHAQHELFLYGGPVAAAQFPRVLARSRRRGRGVVVTIHGVVDLRTVGAGFVARNGSGLPPRAVRAGLRRLIGSAARAADAVIVHDAVFAGRLGEQYGVPTDRIRVIPLPLPRRRPADRDEARRRWRLEAPTALFFGFVTGYKGLPSLLEAWADYRRAGGCGQLIVAGGRHPRLAGGPRYERAYAALKARAKEIGNVTWLGFVSDADIPALLAATDLLVLPYEDAIADSGPLNFALAYDRPVLVSEAFAHVAPIAEAVAPSDSAGFAAALHRLLETPARHVVRDAFRGLAADRTSSAAAASTLSLYRELIS